MKNQRYLFLIICILIFSLASTKMNSADKNEIYSKEAILKYEQIFQEVDLNKPKNKAESIICFAKALRGTKYVAGILEGDLEVLKINLNQTDCILFVESCLALTLDYFSENPSFENFCDIIQNLRYRDGRVDGYTSRLHYASEWIDQAEASHILEEVTQAICDEVNITEKYEQEFSFMSVNNDKYKSLKNNKKNIEKIKNIEEKLNKADYYIIPKQRVGESLKYLKSGDIIGFNTSIKGLDLSHVGIIYKDGDRTTFIHASYTGKKVMIEPKTLVEYINSIRSNNGIRVMRLGGRNI